MFALIAVASATAQTGAVRSGTPVVSLEELRLQASEALFNLDYDAARQKLNEMIHLYPDDPTGPQMMVVPSQPWVRVSPSNQAAHRASRCPLTRISYRPGF